MIYRNNTQYVKLTQRQISQCQNVLTDPSPASRRRSRRVFFPPDGFYVVVRKFSKVVAELQFVNVKQPGSNYRVPVSATVLECSKTTILCCLNIV
jgi:hypothetical protein